MTFHSCSPESGFDVSSTEGPIWHVDHVKKLAGGIYHQSDHEKPGVIPDFLDPRWFIHKGLAAISVMTGCFVFVHFVQQIHEYLPDRSSAATDGPVQAYFTQPEKTDSRDVGIMNKLVAGSSNYSDRADRSNEENLVIMYDVTLAKQFEAEFRKMRGVAVP